MQAFKAASSLAGAGLLAQGLQDEVAPALAGLEATISAVAAAQVLLLNRISATMEGTPQSRTFLGLPLLGCVFCVCDCVELYAALRKVEAEDAAMPSLEVYAQRLVRVRERLGWLHSRVGNMLVRVDASMRRVSKAPPPGLLASGRPTAPPPSPAAVRGPASDTERADAAAEVSVEASRESSAPE
jgi:hypothetical protein